MSAEIKVFEGNGIGLSAKIPVNSQLPILFDTYETKNQFDAESLVSHLRRLADAIDIEIKGGKHEHDITIS